MRSIEKKEKPLIPLEEGYKTLQIALAAQESFKKSKAHRVGMMDKTKNEIFDLSGRVAIITGGAGLLGKQHAEVLTKFGGSVVIADIDGKRAEDVAKNLSTISGQGAFGLELDQTDRVIS